jgi:hypothetical protein
MIRSLTLLYRPRFHWNSKREEIIRLNSKKYIKIYSKNKCVAGNIRQKVAKAKIAGQSATLRQKINFQNAKFKKFKIN